MKFILGVFGILLGLMTLAVPFIIALFVLSTLPVVGVFATIILKIMGMK